MRLKSEWPFEDEAKEGAAAGGGEALPPASSDEVDVEVEDPVVDEFLSAAVDKATKPPEPPKEPQAKASEPAKPPEGTKPPEPPKPAAAAPEAPKPPSEPQKPVEPAAVAPAEPPKAPAPVVQSPQEAEKARLAARQAYVKSQEARYQIPADKQDELLTKPEAILPSLLAEVHTRAVEEATAYLHRSIEHLVSGVLERHKLYEREQQGFFAKWPKLQQHPQGPEAAARIMQGYLVANPKAPKAQIIDDVGAIAMAQLRIPFDMPGAEPSPSLSAPPAPPPPAMPGGGGIGVPKKPAPSIWDKLDQELFTEE